MKATKRTYLILFILALVFIMPGFLAYWFYLNPQWVTQTTVNKGHLLHPPIQLASMPPTSKWHLVLWYPESCEKNCLQQLDQLGRIRLALGRHVYHVKVELISRSPVKKSVQQLMQDHDLQIQPVTEEDAQRLMDLSSTPQIFLVNPDSAVILAYPVLSKPGDVFHDLKHLLTQG